MGCGGGVGRLCPRVDRVARGADHHHGQDVGAERASYTISSTLRGWALMADRVPRAPTLLDALLPIVVLIALLALAISLFGIDATNGPLQVALLLSAAFASLIAFKNGYTVAGVADAAVGGVTSAVGAIFILLAVGALIGTCNMAGNDPDHRRHRDRGRQPHVVLPDRRRGLRPGGHGDRQLLDDSGNTRCRVRRDGERRWASRMPSPRGPSSAARTSATRYDAAVRDHHPGAQARRRWSHGG